MIIEKIVNEHLVEDICSNIGVSPSLMDDFVQEIYLILLEYDRDKIEQMYNSNQLKYWLTRVIKNQWNSSTSPFYTKYRKQIEIVDNNRLNDDNIEDEWD